ncbi:MAG: methionyl-tRNA formyltransferase [Bacilli bacterium]|nr:methionyl-tRNA formyltransferase [Bacilli bacterium]
MNLDDIKIDKELKIIFMGTPTFSVPILEALIKDYKVRAVVTQPDKEVGRGGNVSFSPIKKVAMANTILTLQPDHIRDAVDEILALEPDLIVTCAYGQILPRAILDYPRYGCINVHASLLPKYRGGAPIHRAIMAGAKKTGITIMYMNPRMDEGDIISQSEIEVSETETASSLHDKLSILGAKLLIETLPSILAGTNNRIPQDSSKATYGFIIKREDEKIDFGKTKKEVYNQIRGLNSWPGSYCMCDGKILKVWESYITENYFPNKFNGEITNIYRDGFGVKVENGEVVFTIVQPEGKPKMHATDFINGLANKGKIIGKVLE